MVTTRPLLEEEEFSLSVIRSRWPIRIRLEERRFKDLIELTVTRNLLAIPDKVSPRLTTYEDGVPEAPQGCVHWRLGTGKIFCIEERLQRQ